MQIQLSKNLIIDIDYTYWPERRYNSLEIPDDPEEFEIEHIEMVKGDIIDLLAFTSFDQLHEIAYKQMKREEEEEKYDRFINY